MIVLDVEGMSCSGCVRSVQKILSKSLGLEPEEVEVDLDEAQARITTAVELDAAALAPALERLRAQGFEARVTPG